MEFLSEQELKLFPFDKVCRFCLSEEQLTKPLFCNNNDDGIADKLIYCFSIEISADDELSQQVCENCVKNVAATYDFKKKIENANTLLRLQLPNSKMATCIKSETDPYACDIDSSGTIENMFTPVHIKSEKCSTNEDILKTDYADSKTACSPMEHKRLASNPELQTALETLMASAPVPMQKNRRDCIDPKCHICGKQFSCKGQLVRHLKRHTGIKAFICKNCGKGYQEARSLRFHMFRQHSDSWKIQYKCDVCDLCCISPSTLKQHMISHSGVKPFKCDTCNKAFSLKSTLREHQQTHSVREKQFICELCGKGCLSRSGLRSHLNDTHSSSYNYSCCYCEKVYKRRDAYRNHIKLHTAKNDFLCQICAERFNTITKLKKHVRKKHEAQFECVECKMKFETNGDLDGHVRKRHGKERPFKCLRCGKCYLTSVHLKKHMAEHVGGKQFACKFCERKFSVKGSLGKHEFLHTKERAFKCSLCPVTFDKREMMDNHVEKRHLTKIDQILMQNNVSS